LVAILTHRYLAFLTARTFKNWLLAVIPAILLLYTNYFAWAILACVFLDYMLQTRHELGRHWPRILFTVLLLLIAFLPLTRAFLAEIHRGVGNENSILGTALFEAFNVYALFASESVAPWYWTLGIPVSIAITACAALVLLYAPPVARRLFVYFLLLITGMSLLGIIGTKRLLLISAWAVLPVGLCLETLRTRRWKALLLASLLVIAGVGWFGTVARRFYAAPRFIEPWNRVAMQMAKAVRDRDVVIATHPSFFFYLTYELHRLEKGTPLNLAEVWPYRVEGPPVYNPSSWLAKGKPVSVNVFVIKDVSSDNAVDEAETYLADHCTIEDVNRLVPDSGFSLKERFLPGFPQVEYRIEVHHYACNRNSKIENRK
jgi:MFS family permease